MAFEEQIRLHHPIRTFFRFLRFLIPYWDKVLFIVLTILVGAPLAQVNGLIGKAMIDQVVLNTTDTVEFRLYLLVLLLLVSVVAVWSHAILDRASGFFRFYLELFLTMSLRRLFYRHLHRLPYQFFQDRPIGEHMYRVLEDIRGEWGGRTIVDMVTGNVIMAFQTLNTLVWQGLLVLALDPTTVVFAFVTLLPTGVVTYLMNTRIKRAYLRLKHEEQTVPAILRDSIAGAETVMGYGRRRWFTLFYVRQLIAAVRAGLRRDYLTLITDQVLIWALGVLAVGSLWTYLLYRVMIGQISVGTFSVILGISFGFMAPFYTFLTQWMLIRQQLVPTQRVLETLDVPPAIQDRPNARRLPLVEGRIRFEGVSFAYDPAVPVLRNITFEVKPGETVGIVGRSGAGKTTILNLLLRMHRPDAGRIRIDDHDLDGIRLADWQNQVSIVLQNTFIFGGDVAYNVRYGNLEATDEEIVRALKMAEADEFVAEMPRGIHSDLAEGSKLSGGQKQRLGIARALVRYPRVLILDEPTSSLDSRTENEIWRSFERAMEGTTTIVVSHRLATVRKADRILVLEHGEIVEGGTHRELIRRGGLYAHMWDEQTGGGV